jgi:lipopolysaccharide/colanic/teichoic acid biosynthesis glycosyltransferase
MPRIFAVKEQRASASVQAPRNSDRIKRVNEVAIACACIAFTLPLLLIIALAIRIESPGPILVCHERIGAGGRRLRLFKFRTTAHAPELAGWCGASKSTRIGELLRLTRLDRLTQLFNVARGELILSRLLD